MARARSHQTLSESLGITTGTGEDEGLEDKVDHRPERAEEVKESYPLMNIQEILHSLQGATVFSSLDACGVYHAVRIEPGSQVCTAFISPFIGTFQYIRMPFGLANP